MIWITVAITLLLSAFFSGMEIAFISANKLKVEVDKKKGSFSALLIAEFIKNPSKILGTLLLGNNISLVIFGIAMAEILEPQIIDILGSGTGEYLVLLIQTVISTIVILFTAEFLPKALFRINPNFIIYVFALPVKLFYWVLFPIIHFFIFLSEVFLNHIFGVKTNREEYSFSPIDLNNYLEEFILDERNEKTEDPVDEIQIFKNAIDFKDIRLRECLVPRTDVVASEIMEDIDTLRKKFIESGFSKILIYKDNIDEIVGYIHSSDIFSEPDTIKSVLRQIPFYSETSLAKDVLAQLIKKQISVGVVVDEFGGTAGIVTVEDIIEEIFGEIKDEFDEEELIEKQLNKNSYLLSARHEIDYINVTFNLDLPKSDEYETLGGLIIDVHESIPVKGETIEIGSFTFTIEKATETRIELVKLDIQ